MKRGRKEKKLREVEKFKGLLDLYKKEILTVDEVREFFGISTNIFYRWKKQVESEEIN